MTIRSSEYLWKGNMIPGGGSSGKKTKVSVMWKKKIFSRWRKRWNFVFSLRTMMHRKKRTSESSRSFAEACRVTARFYFKKFSFIVENTVQEKKNGTILMWYSTREHATRLMCLRYEMDAKEIFFTNHHCFFFNLNKLHEYQLFAPHPVSTSTCVCGMCFVYEDPIAMYYTLPPTRFPHDPLISN